MLNHSDYIEYVLVDHHRNFIKFPFFFRHVDAIFRQGLLTSEGELWQRQRRLMAPAFQAQRLAGYGKTMVRHTERILAHWQPGDVRDVHADMMALTLGPGLAEKGQTAQIFTETRGVIWEFQWGYTK
jgi:cytochrome P450